MYGSILDEKLSIFAGSKTLTQFVQLRMSAKANWAKSYESYQSRYCHRSNNLWLIWLRHINSCSYFHNWATLFAMKQMDQLKQNLSLLPIIITMQMCVRVSALGVRFCVYVMPVMWLTWSEQIDGNMWSESLKAKCCSLIHLKIRMPNTIVIHSAIDQRLLIAHANHSVLTVNVLAFGCFSCIFIARVVICTPWKFPVATLITLVRLW